MGCCHRAIQLGGVSMKKKIILLIGLVLLLSGCGENHQDYDVNTIHYDLHISNYYKENIVFTFPSNAYELAKENMNVDYDSLEYILLIDNFSRPIHNNLYTLYGKNIMKFNDSIEVDLNFDYLENDFIHSNYMNTCFEKHSVKDENDYIEINLTGNFYCLQDKTMTIHVSSDYSDEVTNGEKVDDGFEWIIDPSNASNVNIYYKVFRDKSKMATSYGTIGNNTRNTDLIATIEFIVIVLILVIGFFFYKFLYRRENRTPRIKRRRKRRAH